MKILHTVQGYYPKIGGSEELVRKVSEELIQRGHDVTVYTSFDERRDFSELNGVKIKQFKVSGNIVRGIKGYESKVYVDAVLSGSFNLMMNYAAQTWATDLLFPVLSRIPFKKILATVGYAGLHMNKYAEYFKMLPIYLNQYDGLIYHSAIYQDKLFGDRNNISHFSIIPNFADMKEFEGSNKESDFRSKYHINSKLMFLSVSNHYRDKGHAFVIDSFLDSKSNDATLVIIGNPTNKFKIYSDCYFSCKSREYLHKKKIIILTHLPRQDVINAYKQADLFLFGSKVECSPLVIFESMCSKTPWISTNVGNTKELQGGIIVNSKREMSLAIKQLTMDANYYSQLSAAGYSAILNTYNLNNIVTIYEKLYQSLIDLS